MKQLKLLTGTLALLMGFNSIAAWAAQETIDKQKGEKAEKPQPKDEGKRIEPICGSEDK